MVEPKRKLEEQPGKASNETDRDRKIQVRMDESQLETTYANVSNVWGTREELMLDFGMSSIRRGIAPSVEIQLRKRIVLTPHNAKRLAIMMAQAVKKYEAQFGEIAITKTQDAPSIAYSSEDAGGPVQ
jgi:hypothetical protein